MTRDVSPADGQASVVRFSFFEATEHRQYESNLLRAQQRAERLAVIVQSSDEAIFSVGTDGKVETWNAAAERLLGYTAKQAVGTPLLDLLGTDDEIEIAPIIAELRAGRSVERETRLLVAAGRRLVVAIALTPFIEPPGELTGIAVLVRDIGERNRLDEQLRYSEQLHRIAFDHAPTGMAFTGPDGRFTRVNRRLCEISGYSADELLEMTVSQLTHPDDLAHDAELLDAFSRGLTSKYENEKRYLCKDGTVSWVAETARMLFDQDGRPLHSVSVIRDINERKRAQQARHLSEQRVRLATDAAQVGIWSWQPKGDIVEWENEFPSRILGLTSASSPVNAARFVAEFLHPDDRAAVNTAIVATLETQEPFKIECRIRRPDGQIRWIEFTGKTEPADGGRTPRMIGTLQNITERKCSEENLQRLASLVESSDDALFGQDLDGIITSWNHGARQIFGYRSEEVIGSSIMRLVPTAYQAQERVLQQQIAAGQRVGNFETIRQARDGRQFPVSITLSPVKDSAGNVIGASKIVRDITERKKAEERLRQNAVLFSTLIAQAPMGTYVVDAQMRVQQVNAEAMPIFASVQPLIGRDLNEVMEILWGPEVGRQCADVFRQTLVTGERYVSPRFSELRQDLGIEQSFEWETQRVSLPDGQYGVACYFHEVTERTRANEALRLSEQRMRLAAEATGIGVWEWNVLTNQIKWDVQMFRLYGITPTPDGLVKYSDWSDAVLPEDLSENETILQDTVRQCGRSQRAFRIRRRDDGECRYLESVETVRANADGVAEWVIGTSLDVSERRKAQDDQQTLAAVLADTDRRKDEFLATLSHELRNPLATIRSAVKLLPLIVTDAAAFEETRARMERQISILVRLVDDLMDVSRITQDKLTLQKEHVDLAEVIRSAVESSQPFIKQRRHTVTVSFPSQPIELDADATRLTQVFANLLINAAKYSDAGECINILVTRHENSAVIAVRDNGIGIDPAELPRLFEMFAQIRAATDKALGGVGIGLHLVKRLVELHGGSVVAYSDGPGRGSEFRVWLPLPPTASEQPGPSEQGKAPVELSIKPRCRILVADDNEDAAASLSLLLEYEGHEVRTAADGEQAVALATSWAPDVVLLDIGMPKLDGYQACRQIRSNCQGGTVLLLAVTGWSQEQDKQRAREAGFDHHLVKPIDFNLLNELLRLLERTVPSQA